MVNFIILIILHLVGDFYLQTNKIAKCKNANISESCTGCIKCKRGSIFNNKFLLSHSLLYMIPFAFLFYITHWFSAIIIALIIFLSHYFIDMGSCYLNKKCKKTLVFLLDQFVHLMVLFLVYQLFDLNTNMHEYIFIIKMALIILLLIMPSSVIINKLFEDVFSKTKEVGLFDVGSIIGVLERGLVLIFSCFGDFAAIAIIITVKTWARSNDLKKDDDRFRDKYLLGTLASLVLALLIFLIYNVL